MKGKLKHIILLIICFFYQMQLCEAYEEKLKGTLVVTYQTGPKGDRLDRIRFWIKNETFDESMYPRGNAFIDDPITPSRKVVIENLPVGRYHITFVVPNCDRLFAEVLERDIVIQSGSVIKVDQIIKPQYATITAHTNLTEISQSASPSIRLLDKSGNPVKTSSEGKLHAEDLIPGIYVIEFEPHENYITPNPIRIKVEANQHTEPHIGIYTANDQQNTIESIETYRTTTEDKLTLQVVQNEENIDKFANDTLAENDTIDTNFNTEKERDIAFKEEMNIAMAPKEISGSTKLYNTSLKKLPSKRNWSTSGEPIAFDYLERPTGEIYFPKTGKHFYTYAPTQPVGPFGQIIVNSNLTSGHWALFQGEIEVYRGEGNSATLTVTTDGVYRIVPEQQDNYIVKVSPGGPFSVSPNQQINVDIVYTASFGYVNVNMIYPEGEILRLIFKPNNPQVGKLFQTTLKAKNGKIEWQSDPLPTGYYNVQFQVPKYIQAIPSENIRLLPNEHVVLAPITNFLRNIQVQSNIEDAIYLLRSKDSGQTWKAAGKQATFSQLSPGEYTLSFSTSNPDKYIPPPEKQIELSRSLDYQTKAQYSFKGELKISTNGPTTVAVFEEINGEKRILKQKVGSIPKVISLPEGYWRISFLPPESWKESTYDIKQLPKQITVRIRAWNQESVQGDFPENDTIKKKAATTLIFNLPSTRAAIQLTNVTKNEPAKIFQGKTLYLPIEPLDEYQVEYQPLPNYKIPKRLTIHLEEGETQTITPSYQSTFQIVNVNGGKSIIGNLNSDGREDEQPAAIVNISAFNIGTYEVTNEQYCKWLNEAANAQEIHYIHEGKEIGIVKDKEGNLLCKCFDATQHSGIQVEKTSDNITKFFPIVGKEEFPAIFVSWWGAQAYCTANQCRLPTEAEWEKAAGMAITVPGEPLKKWRFGFSEDIIDRTYANYKDSGIPFIKFRVLTTPVGFYNGINLLPLTLSDTTQIVTKNAKSPVGAYDMSGNVWEWCHDWYDPKYFTDIPENDPQGPSTGTKKVAKGGCYDSLPMSVRVTERLALSPDSCDACTGFRIAQD